MSSKCPIDDGIVARSSCRCSSSEQLLTFALDVDADDRIVGGLVLGGDLLIIPSAICFRTVLIDHLEFEES
jgi:hypothetical protein